MRTPQHERILNQAREASKRSDLRYEAQVEIDQEVFVYSRGELTMYHNRRAMDGDREEKETPTAAMMSMEVENAAANDNRGADRRERAVPKARVRV